MQMNIVCNPFCFKKYSWWWYHSKLEPCWNIANNQTKCPLTESWFIFLIGPWYKIVCRNANASMWCVAGDIGLLMVTSCYSFIVPIVQQVYPCFIGVQCRVWHPISSMLIIQMYRQFRHPWGHLIKIFTQQIGEIKLELRPIKHLLDIIWPTFDTLWSTLLRIIDISKTHSP